MQASTSLSSSFASMALQVTHPMKVHTEDPILSAVQRSTLEWMLWRETGSSGGGRIEASAGLSRTSESSTVTEHGLQSGALGDVVVTGGMLGHLPCEEANECLMALIQGETVGTPSERLGRCVRLALHGGTYVLHTRILCIQYFVPRLV